jgi:predicted aspartyl protease
LPNGHIIVPVKIGERSYDFVLDTGAAGITIDPAIAATMHFAIQNQYSNAANAGRIDSGTVVVPEMHVGDLVMHDVYTNTVPQGVEEADRVKTLGLLGFDFICELGITIDYAHKVVFADRYGSYQPLGHALQLPIRLGSFQPMTTVKVNGAIAERMLIDTGAAGATVLLFNYFARRHPEALVDDLGKGARSNPISFNGVGGGFATKPYAFNSLLIGNFNFHDFVGYVVTSRAYSGTQDGLIGSGFLQFFTVQLDYPNGVIYLEPNEKLKAAL